MERGQVVAKKRNIGDRLAAHPTVDLVVAAAMTISYFLAVRVRAPWIDVLAFADSEQRLAVYAAGAGVMSLIAGFSGTAIAQYGSSSGPVVEALRQVHGPAIRKNWLSIVRCLLVAALMCLIAMVIDTKTDPRYSNYLFLIALLIAVTKFLRLSLLFKLIMTAVDVQSNKAQTSQGESYRLQPESAVDPDVIDHG